MPGGAVLSAPFVEKVDSEEKRLNQEIKAYINYWFRHIWEFWWPLYPGVIVVSAVSNLPVNFFFIKHFYFTIIMYLLGWIPLLIHKKLPKTKSINKNKFKKIDILLSFSPLLIMIVLVLLISHFGKLYLSNVWQFYKINQTRLPVVFAMLLTNIFILIFYRKKINFNIKIKYRDLKPFLRMSLLIYSIFLFKNTLQESNLINEVVQSIIGLNLPIFLVVFILTFIGGLITGIVVGGVGISFPFILPLIGSNYNHYVSFGYLGVVLGMLLSPLHLCLILTDEYFHNKFSNMLKNIILPISIMGVLIFLIYLKGF